MRRSWHFVAIACFSIVALASLAATGATTYQFVDHRADQNGFTVSGTITTDGSTGAPANADILSVSLDVSRGSTSIFTATNWLVDNAGGAVVATPTELLFDAPVNNSVSSLDITTTTNPEQLGSDVYQLYDDASGARYYSAYVVGPGAIFWHEQPVEASFVIATAVPEPATLTLFVSAFLCLIWVVYLRQARGRIAPAVVRSWVADASAYFSPNC